MLLSVTPNSRVAISRLSNCCGACSTQGPVYSGSRFLPSLERLLGEEEMALPLGDTRVSGSGDELFHLPCLSLGRGKVRWFPGLPPTEVQKDALRVSYSLQVLMQTME